MSDGVEGVASVPDGVDADDALASRFAGAEIGAEAGAVPRPVRYRDIVVIGASAGGIEALDRFVRELTPELPAAVFVVVHLSAGGRSVLPSILERAGTLPAAVPEDLQHPERGHLHVAPPDRHMLLVGQRVRVTGGPRENGHRPAIDPLFRSAARTYGPRVIGIVLSGTLDDGAAGARMIRERGGAVLVQDPSDALYGDMPRHAVEAAGADAVLPAGELAAKLAELLEQPLPEHPGDQEVPEEQAANGLAEAQFALDGVPTELTCPDCGGPLWERDERGVVQFGCRVGHVFSSESLVAGQGKELERALWAALRGLEERGDLYRRMARRAQAGDRTAIERRFRGRSESAERHATAVREAIAKLTVSGMLTEEPG